MPVSRLVPYNALVIPLSYFFIRNNGKLPTTNQNKLLKQYFWWASLTRRFTSGVEGKIAVDLKRIDLILDGVPPSYANEEIEITLDKLRWHWFSTGDAFCKAILCLYAYFEPKSFASDSQVKIDNSWLKVTTSKNYHHFFPKAYIGKTAIDDWKANTILNITIVDDYLNKRRIKAKPPGEYMAKFKAENPEIGNTMKTHLIDNLDDSGIWNNDFEKFIEERGKRVLEELNKILYPEFS